MDSDPSSWVYSCLLIIFNVVILYFVYSIYIKEKNNKVEQLEEENIYEKLGDKLGETELYQVMKTHRTKIVSFSLEHTNSQILKIVKNKSYRYYPVYDGNIDTIVGVYPLEKIENLKNDDYDWRKDILDNICEREPETKHIEDLIHQIKSENLKLIFIYNEFGGLVGMITEKDIFDFFANNLYKCFSSTSTLISQNQDSSYIVSGSISIDAFNEYFKCSLQKEPKDKIKSLSGFLICSMENIPKKQDTYTVDEITFSSFEIENNKIKQVKIKIK